MKAIRDRVAIGFLFAGKAIRGGNYALAHAGVSRIMPGLANNDEFAAGPMLHEPSAGLPAGLPHVSQ
jgi:hypothetical protein